MTTDMKTIVLPKLIIQIPKTMPKEGRKFEITKQVIASIDNMVFSSDSEDEGHSQQHGGKSRKANDRRLGARKQIAKVAPELVRKQITKVTSEPNMPQGGPSAFFVFMEEFGKEYEKMHPDNRSVSDIGKAGGERWKAMSEVEKAPFVAEAQKRTKQQERSMMDLLR